VLARLVDDLDAATGAAPGRIPLDSTPSAASTKRRSVSRSIRVNRVLRSSTTTPQRRRCRLAAAAWHRKGRLRLIALPADLPDMAAPARIPQDVEYEAAMQRFLALPRRQQLRAYNDLRRYLSPELPAGEGVDRKLVRQAESLETLRDVITHLRISDRPLKAREFDEAIKRLGRDGDWSSSKIVRLWRRWRFALEAVDGEPPAS
jgi:hypothetical protein